MRYIATLTLTINLCAGWLPAEEGMWRLDQLPLQTLSERYGVRVTQEDRERLQQAPVRILAGGGAGTGSFASSNGLILTNHHVALDCIRTSTLAERAGSAAENLIRDGFTAKSPSEELPCKLFRVQVERRSRDVTAELNAAVHPGMEAEQIQQARQRARSDIERTCQEAEGDDFRCEVVDFNSGARSLLITYEEYRDVRLVYAPEKQLGYFGGDEMNFRFPRYVSDVSILRTYQGKDGSNTDYDVDNVPVRSDHFLRVSLDGVKEGDFTMVIGFPGNTNRYRMSFSARYNIQRGIPEQIRDTEAELELLRTYAAKNEDYNVILQSRIFGLSNDLKYLSDLLAALKESDVVADRLQREKDFISYLQSHPELNQEYGGVLDAQAKVYADDLETNADLDNALDWLQRSDVLGYATGLYEFAVERSKASDTDREPQFQERNWPPVRQALLNDDPIILELDEDLLTLGFERAMALEGRLKVAAVEELRMRLHEQTGKEPRARDMARAAGAGSDIASVEARRKLIDAPVSSLEASTDPILVFARALEPALKDQRQRIRVLNEKLFINRAKFARGMMAWKGDGIYPDANFTLRANFGTAVGYESRQGERVPFATRFGGLFELAEKRGNAGDFALPPRLLSWHASVGNASFQDKYAGLHMNFVSTNDTTGGNSGSPVLNSRLHIIGLLFDGNEESIASDWTYSGKAGRAISTDIRFALTVAEDVHGAGWIVQELMHPDKPLDSSESRP